MASKDERLLRTVDSYENDVKKLCVSESSIKEKCIFHKTTDFNVIVNSAVDVMHDVYEGVCNYALVEIILKFVVDEKLFSIYVLNYKLRSIPQFWLRNV